MGLEGEGKAGGDERREGVVPSGQGRRLQPPGLLSLPVRRGVRGGGFILVIQAKASTCRFIYHYLTFFWGGGDYS